MGDQLLQSLVNIPPATSEDSKTLQSIHSTVCDVLQGLKSLSINIECCDIFIVFLVRSKLPKETLSLWEQSLQNHRCIIKWSQLEDFLKDRYEAVERINSMETMKHRMSLPNAITNTPTQIQSFASQEKPNAPCKLCSGDHNLRICPKFRRFTIQERIDYILVNKICNNCLSLNHIKAKCPSKNTCFICKKNHHTLLHLMKPNSSSNVTNVFHSSESNSQELNNVPSQTRSKTDVSSPSTYRQSQNSQVHTNVSIDNNSILLRTALVHIEHMGQLFMVRALIDPASTRSFVSERIVQRLKIPTQNSYYDVSGVACMSRSATKECDLLLYSKKSNVRFPVNAIVLPKIAKPIPSISFEIPQSSGLYTLDLADPTFNKSSQIDIMLGNDCERFINTEGIKKNVCGQASAYNTVFGWVLSGPISTQTIHTFTTNLVPLKNLELNDLLRKFWEQEELPISHPLSQEDQICERIYKETTTREPSGRYIVRLPFKKEFPETQFLGSSRIQALSQYSRMKVNLAKNSDILQQYNQVLEEYISLNHMDKTSYREIVKDNRYFSFYLPHHAVIRPDHKTTKVRVVFNASRKTKSGFSLNDTLYTGPTLQRDLITIILNWRKYPYVFSGDIQKMYRQILVHPDDRPYQRIIFQNDPNAPFKDYQLNTVTFGVKCAPFLAIRTLLQLASDSESQFPKSASILRTETYVDDILSGGYSINETHNALIELIATLKSAGFPLKKITANHSELLASLSEDDLYDSNFLKFHDTSSTKTLGIRWNALTDSFSYSFNTNPQTDRITKRTILSSVAKLFDPAGWLTPVIVRAKLLMQQLWLEGLDWDEEVSLESHSLWNNLVSDLAMVDKITIPRWIQYDPSNQIQIHGFADASKAAFCATVYVRCQRSEHIACSNILVAKSKVAPLKTICLPRLELNGVVLMANLVNYVISALNLEKSKIILWTDSSIVLGWLSKPPHTWETYVANRTSQVHNLVPEATWRHVPTHDNPADLGTRGCRPQDLVTNPLWWNGPVWLTNPPTEWPSRNPLKHEPKTPQIQTLLVSAEKYDILENFSSYPRALRVLCYIFRFFHKSRQSRTYTQYSSITLTHEEVKFVKTRLLALAQKTVYDEEYNCLSNAQPISNKSSLKTLNPFLDSDGIMRVNGRLSQSSLPYNERFPKILPGNSRLCQLYLTNLHLLLLHAECNQMCRMIQTEFYISRLKVRVKKTIRNCKRCIIYKQSQCSQIMAPLPSERCTLSAPFENTGVDFAGPFQLKTSKIRKSSLTKGYACVFVCFSTKAIHLEACSDLSTPAFRAAFTRFVGRRGLPHKIISDNGRNFLGASRELSREFSAFIQSVSNDISQKYVSQGFEWKFIPPHAPHMGGLWEAAVKSFKFHLKRTAGAYKFNFEEFSTILAHIEGVLNSRPISAMSEDPADTTALTPGHFLRGAPIMAFPEPSIENISIVNRWEKLKIINHQLAIRWKEDYLKALHKRYKWKNPLPNLQIGDLVVVIDDLQPPYDWQLGRIVNTYPGVDNKVRTADVRTASGTITRPIVKLCYLPFLK